MKEKLLRYIEEHKDELFSMLMDMIGINTEKAIKDLYKGKKDVSIFGFRIQAQVFLTKLLPHRLIMKIWMKQQKH